MADVIFTGNVGNTDLRFTSAGKPCLSLSVAENHRRKNGQEWVDDGVTWWRVTVWDKQAETLAEHLVKGDRVMVTGTVRSREWQDNDGQKRTSYDVTARHVGRIPRPTTAPAATGGDPWATTEAPF